MARYAEIDDLTKSGLNADLIEDIAEDVLNGLLEQRSRFADDYLGTRYKLPLTAPFPPSLTLAVCQLVAWDVMTAVLGMNPEDAANANWRDRRDEALAWLRDVAAGKLSPVGIVDATPSTVEGRVAIVTTAPRGWGLGS